MKMLRMLKMCVCVDTWTNDEQATEVDDTSTQARGRQWSGHVEVDTITMFQRRISEVDGDISHLDRKSGQRNVGYSRVE